MESLTMSTGTNFRRTVLAAAVAAALGLSGEPATAAPYQQSYDPIDFAGYYIINVPNPTCLLTSGWHANGGTCGGMTLTSIFATSVVSTAPEPIFNGTMTFAPPAISSASELFGLYAYGGAIQAIDTSEIPFVSSSPTDNINTWWIEFSSGHCPYGEGCYGRIGGFGGLDEAGPEGAPTFNTNLIGVYMGVNGGPATGMAQYLGPAVAVAVPEPGTLGLIFGALGGGWLARRRRKKDESPPN
jgi:hypothetical protein